MSDTPALNEAIEAEDLVPVIFAVHNGEVRNGAPMFVQHAYSVPVEVLGEIQNRIAPYQTGWSA